MRPALRRLTTVLLFGPILLLNVSCGALTNNKETIIGGTLLGTVGATTGALACKENKALCAAMGGGAGTVLGATIGHYIAKQERTRTETTAAVGYRPEQGNLLSITEATTTPTVVKQGQDVHIGITYTILRPEDGPVHIKETREVRWNGQVLMSEPTEQPMDQGEQRITWKYSVPSAAKPGTYEVLTRASVDDKLAVARVTFQVN